VLWSPGPWKGFANLSYAKRVSETILDPTLAPSSDITWVPSKTANLGLEWKGETFNAAASLHYQGEVLRRSSDNPVPMNTTYRPASVDPWTSLTFRAGWQVNSSVMLELGATNAFDTKGYYDKNFQYPFDYRIDPRTVWVRIRIN
jgi:outer membrane receptor protein involved in Fe transport